MSDRPNLPLPDELAQVRAKLKELEHREAEIRVLLIANPDARTGKDWVADVVPTTRQQTDFKELKAAHPAIVDEFTYPHEFKRVVLSGIDADTGEIVSAARMRKATQEEATA